MINENVQDLHLNYPNFSEWMNNFDNIPYMLADVAYHSLVLKMQSYNYLKYENMPLCQTLPKGYDESKITEFFEKVLDKVGDKLVKSIILDFGPEAFTKPDLPAELKAIEKHNLVFDSIECFNVAMRIRREHGDTAYTKLFKWGYYISSDNLSGTYFKSHNWWETTAMQDRLFEALNVSSRR